MKSTAELVRQLLRAEATELALSAGRLPCVKVNGAYEPVDDVGRSNDDIVSILMALGGSRHVDTLGPQPVTWNVKVEPVGSLAVMAVLRGEAIQVRIVAVGPRPAPEAITPAAKAPPAKAPVAFLELDPPKLEVPKVDPHAATPKRDAPKFEPPRLDPPKLDPPELDTARRASHHAVTFDDVDVVVPAKGAPKAGEGAARQKDLELDFARHGAERQPLRDVPIDTPAKGAPSAKSLPRGVPAALERLLEAAIREDASDLHLVAERPALLRVAGELGPRGSVLGASEVEALLRPIVPERLEASFERDGSCDFAFAPGVLGRFRVNVARQRTGLKGSFRVVARSLRSLEELGLPTEVKSALEHHQGLVLVTGPTGHGKTTTVAALVDLLNRETTHHIITVEDPIEFLQPIAKAMLSQREVGTHTKSFASALKASLREDPDVIVVGELRDTETVQIALAASETGHLVIGTMNTPSAARTIDRLIDLFPAADQAQVRTTLGGALRVILGQRLLPAMGGGRVAAPELLPNSAALGAMIREGRTYQIPGLQQRGRGAGIITLEESLSLLVKGGRIGQEAAKRAIDATEMASAKGAT